MDALERHSQDCKICRDGRGYLCQRGVLSLVPISRMTLWRLGKAGIFPAPINFGLGQYRSVWTEAEVREWIASRPRAWREAKAACETR